MRPYRESFVYDALNHLVERPVNSVWAGYGGSFSPAHQIYQNERNTVWQYDAAGNLVDSGEVQYTVDAAGQTSRSISLTMIPYNGNPYSTVWGISADQTQSFDGDGQVIKKVVAETTHDNANGDETTTDTTYLIRSSVLGGKVVSENSWETGQRGFVYLGNEVLAWQLQLGTTELVKWEHRDPGNASFRLTLSDGSMGSSLTAVKAELDPLGSNAGTTDPSTVPSLKKLSLYPGFGASEMSSDAQCNLDGMLTPCSTVFRTMAVGAAGQCPNNRCGPRNKGRGWETWNPSTGWTRQGPWINDDGTKTKPRKDDEYVIHIYTNDDGLGHWDPFLFFFNSLSLQKPGVEFLRGDSGNLSYAPDREGRILKAITALYTGKCTDAFTSIGLESPMSIVNGKGIVVGPSTLAQVKSNAAYMGIPESSRAELQPEVGSLSTKAVSFIGKNNPDGRGRVFLNGSAFPAGLLHVLAHEFIHLAGVEGAMGLSSQKLITAEGERVQGYGKIEVYIDGELVEVLSVERCKDLPVGMCDNDLEDKRRYQLPRRGNGHQCR